MPTRRLVQDGQELVYGPNVVADREAMELALLNGTRQFLEPYGISNRYTNYTTHPSQTPGLSSSPPKDAALPTQRALTGGALSMLLVAPTGPGVETNRSMLLPAAQLANHARNWHQTLRPTDVRPPRHSFGSMRINSAAQVPAARERHVASAAQPCALIWSDARPRWAHGKNLFVQASRTTRPWRSVSSSTCRRRRTW